MNPTRSVEAFCDSQRELLKLEYEAEISESTELLTSESPPELQNRGVAFLGLVVGDLTSGLFGKSIATLQHHLSHSRKHTNVTLPQTTITSGDIVGIFIDSFSANPLVTGVVHAINPQEIKVVLDGDDDGPLLWDYPRFNIAKIGSNVTHKRLMLTVNDLEKSHHSLVHYMFGEDDQVSIAAPATKAELRTDAGSALNEPQQEAVRNALSNSLITVILGPPGTGKTTTLAAYIAEAVKREPTVKILACAPSNVAVDNLALRVKAAGVDKIVRVGHPTRVDQDMLSHTLDGLVDQGDFKDSCCDIRKEIHQILDARRGYTDLKILRKDLRERETKAIEQVVRQSNVLFTTCNGSFNLISRLMKSDPSFAFDICVIDECAQGLEISSWIPILQAKKTVLGGDHKQLSATILSETAARLGLSVTLFERAFMRFATSEDVVNTLTVQYRMNERIMEWSNRQFYDNKLVAHETVRDQTLIVPPDVLLEVRGVSLNPLVESPFVFCDTVGVDGMAEQVPGTGSTAVSKCNIGEVAVVQKYLELIAPVFPDIEISVITPYLKQAELIRDRVSAVLKRIEVSTVDSFQGRESDVVIISLVRSNSDRIVGFLSDYRRLNVAVTRAKKQVFIVGNSETISADIVLKSLYDYACENGEILSAATFVDESDVIHGDTVESAPKAMKANLARAVTKVAIPKVPQPPVVSVAERQENFDTLREQVLMVSLDQKYFFTNSLSNSERKYIHELCEKEGIAHGSVGEGFERQIWILRKSLSKPPEARPVHRPPPVTFVVPQAKPAPKAPKTPKPIMPAPVPAEKKPDGICPHGPCRMSTKLVSLDCGLCGKSFCIAHTTPEAHGCGDAAKKKAREKAKKESAHMNSPPIIQGKGGVASQAVRSKMESKIDSMRKERSGKKKNS